MDKTIHTRILSCPYVGMREDQSAFYSYPSVGNRCYHVRATFTPTMTHQEAYCLGGVEDDCPVYSLLEDQTIPRDIRMLNPPEPPRAPRLGRAALLLSLAGVVLVSGLASYRFIPQARALVAPTAKTAQPQPTLFEAGAVAARGALTATPVPSLRPVVVWAAPPTASRPSQRHLLEAPVIVDGMTFVIHRVLGGQTFEVLAAIYDTTPEVIRALNYNLKPTLRANEEIVISPGLKVATHDLPTFETYQVKDKATNIGTVADALNVDAELLQVYNACSDDCALAIGNWVIVPRGK